MDRNHVALESAIHAAIPLAALEARFAARIDNKIETPKAPESVR